MEPTLKQIELYEKLKKVVEKHYMYQDQLMAIAKFIDSEFIPKKK